MLVQVQGERVRAAFLENEQSSNLESHVDM